MSGITEEIRRQALVAAGEKMLALVNRCVNLPPAQSRPDNPAIVALAQVVVDNGEDWPAADATIIDLCGATERLCTPYKFAVGYKARRGRGAKPEKCQTCEGSGVATVVEYDGVDGNARFVIEPLPVDARVTATPCRCQAGRRYQAQAGLDDQLADHRFSHRMPGSEADALARRCWALHDQKLGRKRPTFNVQPRHTVAIKLEL